MRAGLVRVLLEACAAAGDASAGLAAADLALRTGGAWESEARRFRAEFLGALGASDEEVEAELGEALRVARLQGARLLELRAATSLLRHRLGRGRGPAVTDARRRVAEVLEGLTEGWDAPDVRAAREVLAGFPESMVES